MATMPVGLDSMLPHARTWVYKSAVPFTAAQLELISARGAEFSASWAAHGAQLAAAVDVLLDHFVVLAVDEQQVAASGCSIDTSVRFIQRLEQDLGFSLTDRMVVLYEQDGAIRSCRATGIEDLLKNGTITSDTLVYNDLVANVGDLKAHFKLPLRDTWLARYC